MSAAGEDGKGATGATRAGENPYLSARQHWNSQVDRAFSAARTWQVIGVVGLLMGMAAMGGMAWLATLPRYVPFVVEVNNLGEAVAVRPASQAAVADPRVVRASLAAFIASARAVSPDIALEREAVFRVYAMLGAKDPATVKIGEWWNQDKKLDPFSRAANETVSVEIASTNQISESAWQVDWKETIRDRDGNLKEPVVPMRAILNVYTVPLGRGVTEAEIARNPLGIFVRDFNWTRTT